MTDRSRYLCWYGTADAPPALHELRAGPVTAMLDGCELRYISYDDREIVRRIYPSVRDTDWKVVPLTHETSVFDVGDRSFSLEFRGAHFLNDISYTWDGSILGSVDGTIEYTMRGAAHTDFAYNRVGFVILHPELECSGKRYRSRESGSAEWFTGRLPERIAPQIYDPNGRYIGTTPWFNHLVLELDDGLEVQFDCEGELFEMEDQRNWDNSLKTFCTPLSVPYPHRAHAGDTFAISVTTRVATTTPPRRPSAVGKTRHAVEIGESRGRGLPSIGFGTATGTQPLTELELDRMRLVAPDHLRVELHIDDPAHKDALEHALQMCTDLECGLELCLHAGKEDGAALDKLASRLSQGAPVHRVLVWQEGGYAPVYADTTPHDLLDMVRERLSGSARDALFAYGSEVGFAQVNKVRPDITRCDALFFAYCGVVHTPDTLSLCEAFPTQREMLTSTRSFGGNLPISVSPITIRARRNYYVPPTRDCYNFDRLPETGELPRSVDPRQMSLYGAGWTLGTLEAFSSADSLTFYETTGWRGLMEGPNGSPLPKQFPSRPRIVFPLFYVFRERRGWKNGTLLECRPSHPLETAALAMRRGNEALVLVANLGPEQQRLDLDGLPGHIASVRMMDETNEAMWSTDPVGFLSQSEEVLISDGRLSLELKPYAGARITAAGDKLVEG